MNTFETMIQRYSYRGKYLPVGIPAEEAKRVQKKPLSERTWLNGFGKPIE